MEGEVERRRPLSRREFLRRAGITGIGLPSMAAILAACSNGTSAGGGATSGGTGGGLQLASPDHPVTLPITDDNPPIADGLDMESGPLRIFGYNDYIWKKVRNSFAETFKTPTPEYTVFDTPEEMIAKMQSSGSDYDIIVSVTLENIGKLGQGGLIQPLNKSYLPNFSNVWGQLQSPFYDVGSRYSVPYTVYSTGIAWRNDLVPTDIASMDNPYDILFDTTYAGQVHLLNGARDTLSAALLRMGEDVSTTDTAVLDKAKQMLLDGAKAMGWAYDHTDYSELGRWKIHHTWSGQVVYYQYYLPKDESIDQYSYLWPPKGSGGKSGILTNDMFAIPKGAANPVLAHTLINFLLDPDNALTNYSYEGYQPPVNQFDSQKVVSDGLVPANLVNSLVTKEDFDQVPNAQYELELPPATNQLYQQIYEQVTGGA